LAAERAESSETVEFSTYSITLAQDTGPAPPPARPLVVVAQVRLGDRIGPQALRPTLGPGRGTWARLPRVSTACSWSIRPSTRFSRSVTPCASARRRRCGPAGRCAGAGRGSGTWKSLRF
jgi:hypothetical protein